MAWLNHITSQIQNFAHDVLDQDGNYNPGALPTPTDQPPKATPSTELDTVRQEKHQLEETLLQLDRQYQEEMGKVILIKEELQTKLKRAEAELEQYRKGITPVAPAADHEVSLDEDWGDDWGDSGGASASNSVGLIRKSASSAGRLDETAHELLELRTSLEEAQRQLEAGQKIRVEAEKIKYENVTLKNRLEALEQENEMLEAELDGLRPAQGAGSAAQNRGDVSSELPQIDYKAFCAEVVSVLFGHHVDLSEDAIAEARVGLQSLANKVQQLERGTQEITKNVELLEDQKKAILAEKVAVEEELCRLKTVEEDLKNLQGQLKKATSDRESLVAKVEQANRSEASLRQQITELKAGTQTADENDEALHAAKAKIDELEEHLKGSQNSLEDTQKELERFKEKATSDIEELRRALTEKEESLGEMQHSLADSVAQLDVSRSRETSLSQELRNVQALLADLQNESSNDRDEAALLLRKTREQESELQQLRGELQILRAEESQHLQQVDELQQQLQGVTLASFNGDAANTEEIANLRHRLETSEQELELLRHSRDSVVSELEAAKHELDACQQKLVQIQTEAGQDHTSITEQLTAYARQLQAVDAEKQDTLAKLAAAQQKIESLQVVKQSLESGLKQLSNEKEQMVAIVSDKARENTDLKSHVDALMGAVATEKQSVGQLQQQLQQAQSEVQQAHSAHQQTQSTLQQVQLELEQLQQTPPTQSVDVTPLQNRIASLEHEQQKLTRSLQHKTQENAELKQRVQKLLESESRQNIEVQRLRAHLAGVDERHTKEVLTHEQITASLQQRLSELEASARRTDSTAQAVTAAASERVEMLEAELTTAASQRDEALEELSQMEDRLQQSQTSLASLQVVFEQMQRERENQIRTVKKHHGAEQKRYQERIAELEASVAAKEETLANLSETMQATQRLSEQLEQKNAALSRLQQKLADMEDQLQAALKKSKEAEGAEGRVEKQLIKNMLLGYFTASADKKSDVLRCITGYLEFSEEESRKAGIGTPQRGFFGIFGGGQQAQTANSDPNDSFTNQLIAFLEKESAPSVPLRLPTEASALEWQGENHRMRKVSTSSCPPDHFSQHHHQQQQQFASPLTSSPSLRPASVDNQLFNHLPLAAATSSSDVTPAPWTSSVASSSRGSTTSEPDMLRELLGQTLSTTNTAPNPSTAQQYQQ